MNYNNDSGSNSFNFLFVKCDQREARSFVQHFCLRRFWIYVNALKKNMTRNS